MSHVIEIKGIIGFHLHLIVNWTTVLYQARNSQGRRELIFPISSVILEIDNKGKPFLVCGRESYGMTNEQFNQIVEILSAQQSIKSIISDNTSRKGCFPSPKQMIPQVFGPEDLRGDWRGYVPGPGGAWLNKHKKPRSGKPGA